MRRPSRAGAGLWVLTFVLLAATAPPRASALDPPNALDMPPGVVTTANLIVASPPDPEWESLDNIEEFAGAPSLFTGFTSFEGMKYGNVSPSGWGLTRSNVSVAASSTRVLEAAGLGLRLFDTAGTILATRSTNGLFGVPVGSTSLLVETKVFFDRLGSNKRFYVVSREISSAPTMIYLAVSRSAEPADLTNSSWCRYSMLSALTIAGLSTYGFDISIGAATNALVISTNQYTSGQSTFGAAVIRVLNKATLSNNATTCPALPTVFQFQSAAGSGDFTRWGLQPAQHYKAPSSFTGTSNPVYLVNTVYSMSGESRFRVWRVKNVGGGSPVLNGPVTVYGTSSYRQPPDAPQSGSATLLNTGDARISQAAGVVDDLYAILTTQCNSGGGAVESCVRVVRITVGQDGSGNLTATFQWQLTLSGGADVFYWAGALAANTAHDLAAAFMRSSASSFPSTYWTGKLAGSSSFDAASDLTTGTCPNFSPPYNNLASGAHTERGGTNFWLAGERSDGACNWRTRILNVIP